jgi:hypothetical protein
VESSSIQGCFGTLCQPLRTCDDYNRLIHSEKRSATQARSRKPLKTPTLMLFNTQDIPTMLHTHYRRGLLTVLLEKLFGLVDFRCQVGAATAIRVIQHHESPVVLP